MTRFPKIVLGVVLVSALALPALAQDRAQPVPPAGTTETAPQAKSGWWGRERGERPQRADRMRQHQHQYQHRGAKGPMGMIGPMLTAGFDTDADGVVTQAEMEAGLAALIAKHDADGDGALSLEEFAGLHAELMRPLTVRAFQWVDADGDGALSAAEQDKAKAMLGKRLPAQPTKAAD